MRKAKPVAPKMPAFEAARIILNLFPQLGDSSKRLLVSRATQLDYGIPLLPEPTVEKHYTATEIGQALGLSANRIGRITNQLGLKTSEFGEFRLGQSRYSGKQVTQFLYNERGFDAIRAAVAEVTD